MEMLEKAINSARDGVLWAIDLVEKYPSRALGLWIASVFVAWLLG